MNKGLLLVLSTAIISGFAIFVNSIAVKPFDATVFTFSKNLIVGLLIFSLIVLFREFHYIKNLSKRNWLQLMTVGLIGGSIPFVLFFNALKETTPINSAFIHKSMFLFVALLAVFFLKEKLNLKFLAGAILLFVSVFLLFGMKITSFNSADLMILIAVLFWSAENVFSKHLMNSLKANIVAFGRMFFGSLFILLYILFSGKTSFLFSLTQENFLWILITSLFLLGYVLTWYNGLSKIPVSQATSILLLGLPITASLNSIFKSALLPFSQFVAYLILFVGVFLIVLKEEHFFFVRKLFSAKNA
jgi:drug/metabolite transporter (DMT)-like permease